MKMNHLFMCASIGMGLTGCGGLPLTPNPPAQSQTTEIVVAGTSTMVARPKPDAASVAEFDTTTDAQKAAAQAASGKAETKLGVSVASLGAPSEPGFWLKTPLARATGPGRVYYPATGKSVQVTLIPTDGPATGGSQLSLAAFRVIDAPLTALPSIEVFLVR
jgi:hypothetical protein